MSNCFCIPRVTFFSGELKDAFSPVRLLRNFLFQNSDAYSANAALVNSIVQSSLCTTLSAFGCCFINGINMLQADQLTSDLNNLKIFPPCLLSYMYYHCPAVDFTDFCSIGAVANLTTGECVATAS